MLLRGRKVWVNATDRSQDKVKDLLLPSIMNTTLDRIGAPLMTVMYGELSHRLIHDHWVFAHSFACEEVESEDIGRIPYRAFMRIEAPSSDRYKLSRYSGGQLFGSNGIYRCKWVVGAVNEVAVTCIWSLEESIAETGSLKCSSTHTAAFAAHARYIFLSLLWPHKPMCREHICFLCFFKPQSNTPITLKKVLVNTYSLMWMSHVLNLLQCLDITVVESIQWWESEQGRSYSTELNLIANLLAIANTLTVSAKFSKLFTAQIS